VQLGINNPHAPFKQIDVLVVLEPRDVALIWLMTRRQGRRDMLVVRGHLRRPARCEFDYLDPASWSGKDALAHHTPAGWQKTNDGAYLLAAESIEAAAIVREILPIVQRMGTPLLRLSARRTVPHLEIHVASPWTAGVAGREAMQAVKEAGNLLLPQK
jgi:hypothetical protein